MFFEKEFPYAVSRTSPPDAPAYRTDEVMIDDDMENAGSLGQADRGTSDVVTSNSDVVTSQTEQTPTKSADIEQLECGHRESRRSVRLNDYVTFSVRCLENPHTSLVNQRLSPQVRFLIL